MLATLGGVIVALLALSGYVAASVYALARPWRAQGTHRRKLLQSLALGVAAQVLVSPLTVTLLVPVQGDLLQHPVRLATWGLVALLGAPIAIGLIVARLVELVFPEEPPSWPEAPAAAPLAPPPVAPRAAPVWTGEPVTVFHAARRPGDPHRVP